MEINNAKEAMSKIRKGITELIPIPFIKTNIKVYAFVGPSGTGKSYRAQMIAAEHNIESIIDDGLLIKGNKVLAGKSAKNAKTKVQTIKDALFLNEDNQKEIINAIKKEKLKSILILGTSDAMVAEIAGNLSLPEIEKTIYIHEVATKKEIEAARNTRKTEGKHIVPVPTFEIKKDFSGILMDPFQIFDKKSVKKEKRDTSVIRPTFSYLGNFTISDSAIKELIDIVVDNVDGIHSIRKQRIYKMESYNGELYIYLEIIISYGYNILKVLETLEREITNEVEKYTAMNIYNIEMKVTGIHVIEENK